MTNKLKLLLLSIMGIGLGLSFCSASLVSYNPSYSFDDYLESDTISGSFSLSSDYYINNICFPRYYNSSACSNFDVSSVSISKGVGSYYFSGNSYFCINVFDTLSNGEVFNYSFSFSNYCNGFGADGRYPVRLYDYGFFTDIPFPISQNLSDGGTINFINGYFKPYYYVSFPSISLYSLGGGSSSSSDIDVYYNNGNSTETITCDGVQAIQINGLSTITSTNTFTPYFNISYKDEDNQKLIESYSNDILYLENGQFKKTYTGNNDRILTYQGSSDSTFTGYVPVFDVTGSTQPIDTDYNMFNNFTDNSLKVLLSNIPGYIQYVFIIGIILLLLGIVKMFKRRK